MIKPSFTYALITLIVILESLTIFNIQGQAVEDTAEVNKAHRLWQQVKAADRFVKKLDSLYTIDLPAGIVARDDKEGEKYAIIISDIILKEGKTYLNAYMAFTVPGTTKKIAFKGTEIPFSYSGGLQGTATLNLVSDIDVPLSQNIQLVLKGEGKTSVSWDCSGFKEMTLAADVLFDSNLFVPENPDGTTRDEALHTSFQTTISDWNNLMIGISLEPFQFKPLKGVGFSITNAVLDMSDFRNPNGLVLNSTQQSHYAGSPNLWQGLYIQEAEIRMPQQFRKKGDNQAENGGRLTFFAQNLCVDETGFTGKLGVDNLMSLQEGDLGSWNFSVEKLAIDIQSSQLVGAAFNGQIQVPQFKQNSIFNYSATIGLNDTYAFKVGITNSIEMSLWAANLTLDPNSCLNIEVRDKQFLPSLVLNGEISINSPVDKNDENSTKLSLVKLPFQGMRIQTVEPYFSVQNISFGTDENLFSNFPVSISEVGFTSQDNRVGVRLGLKVNFTGENDGGFGGEGVFTVWGKHDDGKWAYDGVEVDKIAVDIAKPGAFELHGMVLFIRGDEVYGNGFKGMLKAQFSSFGMEASALFGNVKGFRYWYADALVTIATGLAAGPISIYGFGGGAFYHMKQAGIGPQSSEIGRSLSGISYAPDIKSGLGIKASVKFGLSGSQNAFNGDVEFGISFTTDGGINQISFLGNAYFVTNNFGVSKSDIMEKAKSMIGNSGEEITIPKDVASSALCGSISMLFDFPHKSFHSTFSIFVNVAGGLIKGANAGGLAGWGVVHFDPSDWYIHLGTPTKPNGIVVLGLARMTNYFMAGKSVPELPDPPAEVMHSLGKKPGDIKGSGELGEGKGFILGSGFNFDTGERTFLIFYGRFGCGMGFDILMKDYGDLECENGDGVIGINGWYAQGQAWAWVAAAVGINVDLPFYSGKFAIFELEVGALLQAKGPNPFWMKGNVGGNYNILGGLVKGHCDFEFEIGEECKIASSSPFGGMPIIGDIKPTNNESDVSVFSTPQVVFNMPIDEVIEFKNESGNIKQYKIQLRRFNVSTTDGKKLNGAINWNSRHDVMVFKSKDILPGESDVIVSAEVSFLENRNGSWYDVTKDGNVATEYKMITFKTSKEPDYIPQENVSYSYPQYRAFNYYKDEANGNYVKLDMGQPKLFQPGKEWVQKAKVTPVKGGQSVYVDFAYDNANNQVNLSLPNGLTNNTIYNLQIVNIPAALAGRIDENVKQQTQAQKIEANGSSTDVEVTTQHAEGSRTELQEKEIYAMTFRTSTYNTFEAKLNSLSYSEGISWALSPLVHSLTVNIIGERFDSYEVENLKDQKMIACEPVLSETNWYQTYIKPLIEFDASTLATINAVPFNVPSLASYFFQSDGTRRLTDQELTAGVTSENTVTSGMKYYMAKYSSEYMDYLKNRIANTYVSSPKPSGHIQNLFNAQFVPLRYGNYPVNVKYTLPGATTPNTVKKYMINYID